MIHQAGLGEILEKVEAGERLDFADGLALYHSKEILALGYLANLVRNRINGDRAYFIYNQHINYSNICTNLCKFCAFGKDKSSDLAYEMDLAQVKEKVRARLDEPITEIHMVGGIHPDLPFAYYLDLCAGSRKSGPPSISRPSPASRLPIWRGWPANPWPIP